MAWEATTLHHCLLSTVSKDAYLFPWSSLGASLQSSFANVRISSLVVLILMGVFSITHRGWFFFSRMIGTSFGSEISVSTLSYLWLYASSCSSRTGSRFYKDQIHYHWETPLTWEALEDLTEQEALQGQRSRPQEGFHKYESLWNTREPMFSAKNKVIGYDVAGAVNIIGRELLPCSLDDETQVT